MKPNAGPNNGIWNICDTNVKTVVIAAKPNRNLTIDNINCYYIDQMYSNSKISKVILYLSALVTSKHTFLTEMPNILININTCTIIIKIAWNNRLIA